MKIRIVILILSSVIVIAFKKSDPFTIPTPKKWPKAKYNFSKNSLNQSTIQLGRKLFYDPILSADSSISCASCHSPYSAFTHIDHNLSHGIDDRIGTRNSPALMNLAWHNNYMWDGSIQDLNLQALAPISHPNEMNEKIEHVVQKLQSKTTYRGLFYYSYGDSSVSGEKVLNSLSQFLLTLISCNSKYDSVMNHLSTFNNQEKKGYDLFKKHCASCHTEPLFSSYKFENNGLSLDTSLKDYGRMLVTKNANDSLKFKVPTLRNIEYTYPYMHDGRFKKLNQVLNHYTNGIHNGPSLSKQLKVPIILNSNEKVDLIAFLLSLSDKHFLFNAASAYPKSKP